MKNNLAFLNLWESPIFHYHSYAKECYPNPNKYTKGFFGAQFVTCCIGVRIIPAIKFWDIDIYILLDKSRPKNEEFVMQSENLNDIETYIKKTKDVSNKKWFFIYMMFEGKNFNQSMAFSIGETYRIILSNLSGVL